MAKKGNPSKDTASSSPGNYENTADFENADSDGDLTEVHKPQGNREQGLDSKGLHIRCPHCSNEVELLVHTPFEEISCDSCGSFFNLCERDDNTQVASALQRVGQFELVSRLGIGGFGTVWKARDTELDRIVAVKLPRKGQLSDAEVEQFFREARAAAQLRHPNIVPVHEVGRHEGAFFIVSDLIRGATLSDWLTGKTPSPQEAVAMLLPVAEALQHAHQQGVIHRDLKPSNIMIDEEGRPYLMDFGLAKREFGEITMTVDGQVLGTPSYMSPEQADGKSHWTDRRTDIYSMGVMLFQMLTGELPFRGNAQMQIMQRLNDDAPKLRKLNRHIPRDLETICLKCLERDPNKRYSTAAALAAEFKRFLEGLPIKARPLSRPKRLARWARRKPALATIALLITAMALVGPTVAVFIESQRQRLSELLSEKNHLITRYADDRKQDTKRIGKLESELGIWEGKANPWEFWPPKAATTPRHNLMKRLYSKHYVKWEKIITSPDVQGWSLACGQLGLGILAQESGHNESAEQQLKAAKRTLEESIESYPSKPEFRQALGDCLRRLASLKSNSSPEESAEFLDAAIATYQYLAEDASQLRFLADWLDLKLRSATGNGFKEAGVSLNEADRISTMIEEKFPDDPVLLYELVCRISEVEPIFLENRGEEDENNDNQD